MKVNDRYCSFYYEDDDDWGEVEIDPETTALLVIDMQHVFITRPEVADSTEAQRKRAELEILNNIYCHVINTDELLAALGDA